MLTASVHPRLQAVWLNANQKYTKVMASWQLLPDDLQSLLRAKDMIYPSSYSVTRMGMALIDE
jgi:hypothetical protein